MNAALLDHIENTTKGILATILRTEGHTYKKAGEKALFLVDNPFAVYGNLGSLCVDQDIVRVGKEAYAARKPQVVKIDTSDPSDIHLGYGTYCGGMMEILLEPISEAHKVVYRELGARLDKKDTVYLRHHLRSGDISIWDTLPERNADLYVEEVAPRLDLFMVGATPLARQLIPYLADMNFRLHIVDWRAGHLEKFEGTRDLILHDNEYPFDSRSLVLILTHSFERDKEVLKTALAKACAYVGLLSSKSRRDTLFETLAGEGVSVRDLGRVSSPVGIDLHAKTDPEIAIGIAAEIVGFINR